MTTRKSVNTTLLITLGAILLYLPILAWGLLLERQPDKTTFFNYLFNAGYGVLYFYGGVVGIAGAIAIGLKKTAGKALFFLGLSLVSQTIAMFTWAYYNIILHVAIPSPSVADLFFLVFFLPLATIGFVYLIAIMQPAFNVEYILETAAIFIISLAIIFGIAERPDISSSHGLVTNLINISYPFVDCILLSFAALALRINLAKLQKGYLIITLGFLFQVAADITYSVRVGQGNYWNGDIADKLYATAAFVITLGMSGLYYSFSRHKQAIRTSSY